MINRDFGALRWFAADVNIVHSLQRQRDRCVDLNDNFFCMLYKHRRVADTRTENNAAVCINSSGFNDCNINIAVKAVVDLLGKVA